MARYLTETTEVYRVDSEFEAAELIDAAKRDDKYTLAKYSSVKYPSSSISKLYISLTDMVS